MTDTQHTPIDAAIHALLAYQQADMDGIMVTTSRQAIHEVTDELAHAKAVNAELVEAVEEVMSWINNWQPRFVNDGEWEETELKVCNALFNAKPQQNQ